jgi:adenylosuccinate synthase
VDGIRVDSFPDGEELVRAKPVYENLKGFHCDISACRKKEELPEAARGYIAFIEKSIACKIKYVSVGAGREAYIEM